MDRLVKAIVVLATVVGGINIVTISAVSSDDPTPDVETFVEWPCANILSADPEYCYVSLTTGKAGP